MPRLCEFPGLGDWVIDQRRQYKLMMQGKPSVLDPERQRKLEELGFVWVVRNRPEWNNRYQELLQYKDKYGDTASFGLQIISLLECMPLLHLTGFVSLLLRTLFRHYRKYHSTTRKLQG